MLTLLYVNPGMNKVYLKAGGLVGILLRLKGIIIQRRITREKASHKVQTAREPLPLPGLFVHSVLVTDYNFPIIMSGLL